MIFSTPFKSSSHSLPSPDGQYIATLLEAKLSIRRTRSLDVIRVITLPFELAIHFFLWSPSSSRILVASSSKIRVYSPTDSQFVGKISDPISTTAKTTFISFGATHDEIMVFSDFGLKLSIINTITSKSVEILSPKFYTAGIAPNGYSYRRGSGHMALLTRCGGKDVMSLHAIPSREITRSFVLDTIDAQGVCWTPDGMWIAVWEAAGQGHKVLLYSADGHLYRSWCGPEVLLEEDKHFDLGPGVKTLAWALDGGHLAVGNHSLTVSVLKSPSLSSLVSLRHTNVIEPLSGLQIWQEQINHSLFGHFERGYALATQAICPPHPSTSPAGNDADDVIGTTSTHFDASGTILATASENMPTAVWIWDLASKILKAVLVQHNPIAKIAWHPSIPELLMIRCDGEECKALAHLWEPSWETPRILDFGARLPEGKVIGRPIIRWLATANEANGAVCPAVFFSDSQDCLLASLSDAQSGQELPWQEAVFTTAECEQLKESPLQLVPENKKPSSGKAIIHSLLGDEMDFGLEDLEDTFDFRTSDR